VSSRFLIGANEYENSILNLHANQVSKESFKNPVDYLHELLRIPLGAGPVVWSLSGGGVS
jgi:hypothetical protein